MKTSQNIENKNEFLFNIIEGCRCLVDRKI